MSDQEIAQFYGVDLVQLNNPELRKRATEAYTKASDEAKELNKITVMNQSISGENITCNNTSKCTSGPIGSKCPGCKQYRF